MNRKAWSGWTALILAAVLLAGIVPAARAAKKAAEGVAGLESLEEEWFYLPETVPAEFLPETETEVKQVILYGSGEEGEYAETVDVEFAEGDEALKDALRPAEGTFVRYVDGAAEEITACGYVVDLSGLRAPGQAVFRLTIESAHYAAERKCALRVLSWEEDPLVTVAEEPLALSLDDLRTEAQIAEGLAADHAEEIGERKFRMEDARAAGRTVAFYDPETHGEMPIDTRYLNVSNGQEEPETAVVRLLDPQSGEISYRFRETGTLEAGCFIIFGNIRCERRGTVAVVPYRIGAGREVSPGGSTQASVTDAEDGGRTFTWTVEGAGVRIDPDSGILTADENAAIGSRYMLTAAPADGGLPVKAAGTVAAGALSAERFEIMEFGEGFSVPVLSSENGKYENGFAHANELISRNREELPYLLYEQATWHAQPEFLETREAALALYDQFRTDGMAELDQEIIEIDGRPVLILAARTPAADPEQPDLYYGLIRMARNNVLLQMQFYSYVGPEGDIEDLPRIRREDLQRIAKMVRYDPSKASITVEDGALTVSAKDGDGIVLAGQKLQLTAKFANPEKVNRKAGNNALEWSVADTETGEAPEGVSIDGDGRLSVKKGLDRALKLEVKAASPIFHTEAVYPVTASPALRRMTIEPEELTFFAGTEDTAVVRIVTDPEDMPALGLSWSATKKGVAEVTEKEDGTAEIRPLAAGKVILTAKSPGGKTARVTVTVLEPVTKLTLSVKAKPKPGKTITVTAAIEPRGAGSKKLEWSVDAPEGTATINQKGQLKISKDAVPGTVITVNCRAVGAPDPVGAKLEITVE